MVCEGQTEIREGDANMMGGVQVAYSVTGKGDREGWVAVKELPGGFVWIGTVMFYGQDPTDVRVEHGLAKTFDEARAVGSAWCEQQLAEGPKAASP